MLGYICKYAPIEILESMGAVMKRIEPQVSNFNQADTLMHPNICSFAKGILEEVLAGGYEGVILTTCCDSIRRLYDVLKEQLPDRFIYMLDTPRITGDGGAALYEKRILEMAEAYKKFSGRTFCLSAFQNLLQERTAARAEDNASKEGRISIGIAGARASESLKSVLRERNVEVVFDLTCTCLERKLLYSRQNTVLEYAKGLLAQFPCMRMINTDRDKMLLAYADKADGVLYHTVQFCDNYSYEYAWLKEILRKPLLLLETDYTAQSYGQVLTRIEAFLESLKKTKKTAVWLPKGEKAMYVLGIDSGSTSTNAVIMDQNREIKAFSVVRTGAKSGESANRILAQVLEKANLKREDIGRIVSTGYGRVSIPFADENVTEISCHGRGAHYFNPAIRTILDIGGQDSKAIRLNGRGEVVDFVMNDKCAAGTGRFLEMIARTLEVDIDDLGPIALQSTEKIEITSMCSVFAESEVISLIANNKEKSDIADGVCHAIANKSYSLLKRVGLEKEFMMTGGVAKNPGVVRAVEEKLQASLYICPEPEIVGAAGAALYALDSLIGKL